MIRFIDKLGSVVLEAPYDTYWKGFREGLLQVFYSQHLVGFINKSCELVIKTQFDEARNFSEGVATVRIREKNIIFPSEKRCGAIDKNGQLVFEVKFDNLYDFSEGIAIAEKDNDFHFVDKHGKVIHSFSKNKYYIDTNGSKKFSEGLLAVFDTETEKWGFMNKEGKLMIEPQFENAANFSEGLARVSIIENHREYLGFIDTKGVYVIEPKFDIDHDFLRCSNDFSEGLASLVYGPLLLNKDQNFIFINRSGEIVLNTEFFRAEDFQEGLAMVWDEHSEKCGYIDKSGDLAIPLRYSYANGFSEGLALVS